MPDTLRHQYDEAAAVEASGTTTVTADASKIENQPPGDSLNDSWQTQAGFTIDVPPPIEVTRDGAGIILQHTVPYGHTDPCDFKDGQWLPELTDFHVKMEILPAASLAEAIKAAGYPYLEGEQSVHIDGLDGYLYSIGAEGCGQDIYLFPQGQSVMLLVVRDWITELSNVSLQREQYLTLQGVISSQQEMALFRHILSSYRLLEAEE